MEVYVSVSVFAQKIIYKYIKKHLSSKRRRRSSVERVSKRILGESFETNNLIN